MDQDLGFADYRQLYANGTDVERLDGPFQARLTGWRFAICCCPTGICRAWRMPVRSGCGRAPETAMLSDFLQSLVRHAQTLDDQHDGALARTLIELLPTALGGPPHAGGICGVEF